MYKQSNQTNVSHLEPWQTPDTHKLGACLSSKNGPVNCRPTQHFDPACKLCTRTWTMRINLPPRGKKKAVSEYDSQFNVLRQERALSALSRPGNPSMTRRALCAHANVCLCCGEALRELQWCCPHWKKAKGTQWTDHSTRSGLWDIYLVMRGPMTRMFATRRSP